MRGFQTANSPGEGSSDSISQINQSYCNLVSVMASRNCDHLKVSIVFYCENIILSPLVHLNTFSIWSIYSRELQYGNDSMDFSQDDDTSG